MRFQNTFSRVVGNDLRMGAFYTDPSHCRDLAKYFSFSNEKETTVLEPSIGDGVAVELVTAAEQNPNIRIFGVELNKVVAEATAKKQTMEVCLEADFLEGVRISQNAFSFCFANPPYINDDLAEGGTVERTERQFLEKVTGYLCKGGMICWVIPYHVFSERNHFRYLVSRYEIHEVLRFREEEYRKFKQVAIIATKKTATTTYLKDELDALLEEYCLDKIPVLSDIPRTVYTVPSASKEQVKVFACKNFDTEVALHALQGIEGAEKFSDLFDYLDRELTVKKFMVNTLGRSPIPLKKDSLYLIATSGAGQGLTGSLEEKDLHLQRGVVEVIEESEFSVDESSEKVIEKVTKRTKVTMTIIQNDGTITVLE